LHKTYAEVPTQPISFVTAATASRGLPSSPSLELDFFSISVQGLVKDLAYAGLNTRNWGMLAAERRTWRMTLNNLGTNGLKLISAACADAATADLARDLALSASVISAADAEVAWIVAQEQVETATRAAAAPAATALTSTTASEEAKEREGVGGARGQGGGGLKTPTTPMVTRMRSQRSD